MDKDKLMKAGAIVAQVRDEVAAMIKPDISFIELMDFSEKRIVELGGEVAWAQISPNEIAAHYCPTDSDNPVCTENDLISIDLGVHIDGNIADTAITIDLSGKYQYLIDISKEALEETIKIAVPGTKLCELGKKQEEIAKKHGVSIITNLGGHTLGLYKVHAGITIPTYDNGDETILEEGMAIAIEPFITTGHGKIEEKGESTVFMQMSDKNTRSLYARKILPYIKKRNGLPFTQKEIERTFTQVVARIGLRDLIKEDIIRPYPPLVHVEKQYVAQMEHSIIVANPPIVYTKLHKE